MEDHFGEVLKETRNVELGKPLLKQGDSWIIMQSTLIFESREPQTSSIVSR